MLQDERRAALSAVPVIERAGRAYYVRMADIPPPWEAAFRAALRGSACPAIDGEGECAYAWDWHDWLNGSFPRQPLKICAREGVMVDTDKGRSAHASFR
ncbi:MULTISPECIES: hypothetical protein [unclassified Caballeronia]|uniref:hypothetical protein n=1 Tax=unclassified Caballeronia TaxID=2646786 RepID=UPI002029A78D|nr:MULTISPECIES: hypothetical protein [unclassified Caballeronia]